MTVLLRIVSLNWIIRLCQRVGGLTQDLTVRSRRALAPVPDTAECDCQCYSLCFYAVQMLMASICVRRRRERKPNRAIHPLRHACDGYM